MGSTWVRAKDVVWEEINGEMLLINSVSGTRWLLNATASVVWRHCDGMRIIREAAEFCDALARLGLLVPSTTPAPIECHLSATGAQVFQTLGAGGSGRRRPSPRGVSGPI